MQISNIVGKAINIELTQPLKVTFGEIKSIESLIIKITTDSGLIGYGEACPFEPVTGESIETEQVALNAMAKTIVGEDPFCIERLHSLMDSQTVGHTALKAGIDIALYDLLGKATGLPVYKLLGGNDNQVHTDITISIGEPRKMANEAVDYVNNGFSALKIKTGIDQQSDEEAIREILNAVGDKALIKIDANQGWNAKQTIRILNKFQNTQLQIVEQPLPYWQHEENKVIRNTITQDLMLDESVHTPSDAYTVISNGEADIVNIKLMKSTGIYGAEGINQVAEAAGVRCMIGCMAETRLGICAAVHFAAAHQNVAFCDLDSFLMFKEPDWLTGGFTNEGGLLTLTDKPGLGMDITI